ncbi:hypothetical protein GCM10023196_098720 [Actinoallomurus vinaceus]|uniref:Secreted protein n=1 Tax=Actinoallomurus vinaceus TaxID=1080074 RepID=A0ABP8UU17_9ACTN
MFKPSKTRRAVATTAAALALTGGATVAMTGTAHAGQWACGEWQGGTSPWNNWFLMPCIKHDDAGYVASFQGHGGSTDVRAYVGIYDSCNGATYGMNPDSDYNHWWPGSNTDPYINSYHVNISCSSGVWAIGRVFESGNGSPWAWSRRAYDY